MKIFQFPKSRWTGGPYPEGGTGETGSGDETRTSDFQRELEFTRQNESLMAVLVGRARQIACVSLEEIRQQLREKLGT